MAQPSAHPYLVAATADLYRAAIGPQGQDYYLEQFQRFDAKGRAGLGWNGPAFWLTLNWLLFRRMWGWALAYGAVLLGLAGLIFGLGRELFDYSYPRAALLFLALLPLSYLIPGLYADAWYYRHCQRKIAVALARSDGNAHACQLLKRQAPSRRGLQGLLLAHGLLLALAALWISGFLQVDGNRFARTATDQPPSVSAPSATPRASPAVPASTAAAAPSPAPAVSAPAMAASAAAPVEARAPALRPLEPAVPAASSPVAAKPAHASRVTPPLHVWVIQVGAYTQQAHAQHALTQVRALGLEAGAEAYDTAQGRLIRVRVGPFARRDEAEQAARRIRALQLPVLLLRQRP